MEKRKQAVDKVKKPVQYKTEPIKAGILNDFQEPYITMPRYNDAISLLDTSKKGLDAKSALDFLSLSGFTQDEFQETFKTTVKTIQNHVTRQLKLDASLSEKLLKSFALFDSGIEVFGSAQAFGQWLRAPAYGLGNRLPFDLMDTITGIQLIDEELSRIKYGDLA